MDITKLHQLIRRVAALPSETEWVEFKHNRIEPARLGQIISAISNTLNLEGLDRGFIIFGIDDKDHSIIGTDFNPRTTKIGNEEMLHWISQRLNPKINIQLFETIIDQKSIIVFQVPPAIDKPVTFTSESFIRIGSITRPLIDFPEKERIIWANPAKRRFETELALRDLDSDSILKELDYPTYFSLTNTPLPPNKESILQKLEDDCLIKSLDGGIAITNKGALLFAKNLNTFDSVKRKMLRVIIYTGKSRTKTLREFELVRGYASGFSEAVELLNTHLPTNEEIEKVFRLERPMYPDIALRELIANALVHQDFNKAGEGPMIEVFEDRIEISNPGSPIIDPSRFIDSTPKSRNEDLASCMRRINICEERGSGIDKVIYAVELFQLPAPKFETPDGSTRVVLYASKKFNSMSKEDKIRACYQHCVLKYVSNESMSNQTLRKRFNIKEGNYSIASRIISDTVAANLIKPIQVNSRKYAKYVPIWA